jgi:GxxExxY protein
MGVTFRTIHDIAEKVFENLGSGHSEFAYRRAVEIEFRRSAINYESEKRIVINYIDSSEHMYSIGEERLDLYVRTETDEIIIELKALINPPKEMDFSQIHKYKRELNKINVFPSYGILINFPQPGTKEARGKIDFFEIKL